MNARIATAALALLAALTLTGCAGAAGTTGDERTAPAASESAAINVGAANGPTSRIVF